MLGRALVRRGGEITAAGCSASSRDKAAAAARVWGGDDGRIGIGFQGAAGWFKEGAPRSRRARPIRKAGEITGPGITVFVAHAWRGGDDSTKRARVGSERATRERRCAGRARVDAGRRDRFVSGAGSTDGARGVGEEGADMWGRPGSC